MGHQIVRLLHWVAKRKQSMLQLLKQWLEPYTMPMSNDLSGVMQPQLTAVSTSCSSWTGWIWYLEALLDRFVDTLITRLVNRFPGDKRWLTVGVWAGRVIFAYHGVAQPIALAKRVWWSTRTFTWAPSASSVMLAVAAKSMSSLVSLATFFSASRRAGKRSYYLWNDICF